MFHLPPDQTPPRPPVPAKAAIFFLTLSLTSITAVGMGLMVGAACRSETFFSAQKRSIRSTMLPTLPRLPCDCNREPTRVYFLFGERCR